MLNNHRHIVKTNRREPFWFHTIRALNYFCYRFWWLVLLLFFTYLILWYWFCFRTPVDRDCNGVNRFSQTLNQISKGIDDCCPCEEDHTEVTPTPPEEKAVDCPDRELVFQVCNSNSARDDNFDVYLNGVMIGKLDLNENRQIGSIFIASNDHSLHVTEADFTCPISNMRVYYFDPSIVKNGQNNILLKNTQNNRNDNEGVIEIRNYLIRGKELVDPCKVRDVKYDGSSGVDIARSFNYTKCCE